MVFDFFRNLVVSFPRLFSTNSMICISVFCLPIKNSRWLTCNPSKGRGKEGRLKNIALFVSDKFVTFRVMTCEYFGKKMIRP